MTETFAAAYIILGLSLMSHVYVANKARQSNRSWWLWLLISLAAGFVWMFALGFLNAVFMLTSGIHLNFLSLLAVATSALPALIALKVQTTLG